MFTVLELLLILAVGILLIIILTRVFGKAAESGKVGGAQTSPSVKLVRTARAPDGREETRLMVNEKVILAADNEGVRLAEYADEVEQLEAVAARMAAALSVGVEFARVGAKKPDDENGIPMRAVPKMADEAVDEMNRPRTSSKGQGAA